MQSQWQNSMKNIRKADPFSQISPQKSIKFIEKIIHFCNAFLKEHKVTELCLWLFGEFYSTLHESSSLLSYLLKHATCLTLQGFVMLLSCCCVVKHFEELKCSITRKKKGANIKVP